MTIKTINVYAGDRFVFETHINEFLIRREETRFSEAFLVIIPPNMSTHCHVHHEMEQMFFVLSGKGMLKTGIERSNLDNSCNLKVNDLVTIPTSTWHMIINENEEPLKYLCINSFESELIKNRKTSLDHAESVLRDYALNKNTTLLGNQRPILIVGAAGFVGYNLTLELLEKGIPVWAYDKIPFPVNKVRKDLLNLLHCNIVDISNESEFNYHLSNDIREQSVTPKVLLTTLGTSDTRSHIFNMSIEKFREQIDEHLVNYFISAKTFSKILVDNDCEGSLVFIGSVGANRAHREQCAYDAAKGGIESLTRSLALDLAPYKINVNTIALGPIEESPTSIDDYCILQNPNDLRQIVPIQRYPTISEITHFIRSFLTNSSLSITGQVITIDGGLTAQLRPVTIERLSERNMYFVNAFAKE
ncbi:SDR family oxidoreductase [Paenibacillus sp. 32O-W]|uniref:SDR family oxidoreductase n=1 Tax=Paenibacillus sp. 32O-W TaxID=1695218 RepID=UPI0011A4BD76|nr:SDR family oxidoreductase [Paenibacillus sp. 32O-W]